MMFYFFKSSGYDISLYGLSNGLPQGFSLVNNYFPSDVPANGSATFIVQMDADSVGNPYGQLAFSDGDPGGGYYSFTISGMVNEAAAAPILSLYDGATSLPNGSSDSFGTVAFGA